MVWSSEKVLQVEAAPSQYRKDSWSWERRNERTPNERKVAQVELQLLFTASFWLMFVSRFLNHNHPFFGAANLTHAPRKDPISGVICLCFCFQLLAEKAVLPCVSCHCGCPSKPMQIWKLHETPLFVCRPFLRKAMNFHCYVGLWFTEFRFF